MKSILALVPVAIALLACGYDNNNNDRVVRYDNTAPPTPNVTNAGIDTGQMLETDPGHGAGVFVEYAAGGTWHVFTTCDTAVSHVDCNWDIVVTSVGPSSTALGTLTADNLESEDDLFKDNGAAHLVAFTSIDTDGFFVSGAPGATLRVDALLDALSTETLDQARDRTRRFIFWIGGGGVQAGAPSNPLDLTPTTP